MKHSVTHTVGKEMATKVAKAALSSYASRFTEYGAKATWATEDRADIGFSVKGMSLNGKVEVRDQAIDLELDVPFILKPFQRQAMAKIESEIDKWMAKAKRGEIE
jgi:hypothetical protein